MEKQELIENIKNGTLKFNELKGSEKQIKWATELRAKNLKAAINELNEDLEDADNDLNNEFVVEDLEDIEEIINEANASTIISWKTSY